MILKNTVFILGAGASNPFGFPLGIDLLQEIYEALIYKPAKEYVNDNLESGNSFYNLAGYERDIEDDSRSSNELFQMLLNLGYSRKEIEKFANDLIQSQLNSVDAFLEHRIDYIEIGKCCIAYILLKHESHEKLFENPDWYKYLWNKIYTKFDDLGKNKIAFITFNYDRSLEYYLSTSMAALFGKTEKECVLKLSEIPIVHLHGQLGDLTFDSNTNQITYGQEIEYDEQLLNVAKSIKIVHESVENDEQFSHANELLQRAESICILGFGFHQQNVKRLKLHEIRCPTFASAYGLTNLEIRELIQKNGYMSIDNVASMKCLEFLRKEYLFQ